MKQIIKTIGLRNLPIVIRSLVQRYPFLRKLLYPVIFLRRLKYTYQEKVYQHLCELLIEDPVIKVPEFQGVFIIDCRTDIFKRLLINKDYESSLVNLVIKHLDKNRDAIDVGANIGFYTVLFAKILSGRKVLAIEPSKNSLQRLYKNLANNNVMDKVIVFEGAVSDYVGIGEIKTLDGKEEYSTLGQWKHPAIKDEGFVVHKVEVSTIDNLVDRYSLEPGFIKIDVEGMEHLVLKGARATLENYRPIVLSELSDFLLKHNGSSSVEVINFFKSLDYIVIDAETPDVKPELKPFTNILCIPKEVY